MECPHTATVLKLENDMYHGDARKPGITTRMESQEDCMEQVQDSQKTMDRKFNTIIVLLITLLGGVVGELVRH